MIVCFEKSRKPIGALRRVAGNITETKYAQMLRSMSFTCPSRRNAQKQEENRTGQSSVPATDVDKCNKAISAEELPGYTQTIDINYLESQAKTCEM